MQAYLQSITVRVEEWRLKRRDTEEWMRHRQLPHELREKVRQFVQYKWLATRGVDEESILQSLPADLRRDIKKHLCLDLVRRVRRSPVIFLAELQGGGRIVLTWFVWIRRSRSSPRWTISCWTPYASTWSRR